MTEFPRKLQPKLCCRLGYHKWIKIIGGYHAAFCLCCPAKKHKETI